MRQKTGTQTLVLEDDPDAKDTILCRLFGHRRSGVLAFTDGDGVWKSRCKRCGTNMVRIKRRRWIAAVLSEPPDR